MKTKMQFPKNEKQDLGLVQHYLVFQIYVPVGTPFSLEIVVTDTTKVFISIKELILPHNRIKED